MRREASVLHLDLDAFFASVEQRDKPSLRGKPVIVGGVGQRGVVATASYEARVFGVRSAMPTHEARRRCPHAAFLSGRFGAYRAASEQVMRVLRELSPLVEPLSLDEAFVDLAAATEPVDLSAAGLDGMLRQLRRDVAEVTGGLAASVGAASSKFMAKLASELAKPDGQRVIEPGTELELLAPMPVAVIPGVGPVTAEKLRRLGLTTIADLRTISVDELAQTVGRAHAQGLVELAYGRDDRPVVAERETKSISVEDTFETDLVDPATLLAILDRDARSVAARLRAAEAVRPDRDDQGQAARLLDPHPSTQPAERDGRPGRDRRDRPLAAGRGRRRRRRTTARGRGRRADRRPAGGAVRRRADPSVVAELPTTSGMISPMAWGTAALDDRTAAVAADRSVGAASDLLGGPAAGARQRAGWPPGADVTHETYGPGWVWGSGLGRVTVRFETRDTPPGPVRTFSAEDPALHLP